MFVLIQGWRWDVICSLRAAFGLVGEMSWHVLWKRDGSRRILVVDEGLNGRAGCAEALTAREEGDSTI